MTREDGIERHLEQTSPATEDTARIRRMKQNGMLLAATALAIALSGCAASPATRVRPAPTTASASAASQRAVVTGWGATLADWLTVHQALTADDSSFGPDRIDGSSAKYTGLVGFNQPGATAEMYNVTLPGPTPEASAMTQGLREFPADATIVASTKGDGTCHLFRIHSATLTAYYLRLGKPAPMPYMELVTDYGGSPYSANAVDQIDLGNQAPGSALGGC